jgi:hypothetical protein
MSALVRSLFRLARGLATLHVGTSLLSVGTPVASKVDAGEGRHKSALSPDEERVLRVAKRIYSGGGLDEDACTAGVVFEDPVAKCVGIAETSEAFRALRVCKPEHVSEPWIASSDGQKTVVRLHQRYFGWLVVRSVLHVQQEDSLIARIEERWKGVPLVAFPELPVDFPSFCRRLNGIVSYQLTRLLC